METTGGAVVESRNTLVTPPDVVPRRTPRRAAQAGVRVAVGVKVALLVAVLLALAPMVRVDVDVAELLAVMLEVCDAVTLLVGLWEGVGLHKQEQDRKVQGGLRANAVVQSDTCICP